MHDTLEEILAAIRDAAKVGWPGCATLYITWSKDIGWRITLSDTERLYGLGNTLTIAALALLGVMRDKARGKVKGHEDQAVKWREVIGRDD